MFPQLKLFIFIIIIYKTEAQSDEQISKIDEYNNVCMKESHVDPDLIEAVKHHQFNDEDSKLKEHGYCFAKKLNFINIDGSLQIDVIRSKLADKIASKTKVELLVNECARTSRTVQETAYYLLKCLHINVPQGIDFVN